MTTQKRYDDHFEFFDREGQFVSMTRGQDNKPTLTPVGRAYTFFNCRADSPEVIATALPGARHASRAPNDLELSVINVIDNLPSDTPFKVKNIAHLEAKPAGIRYVLVAKLPNATNEQTARELHGVVNLLYNEPSISIPGDKPQGLTLYQDEKSLDYLSVN